jgi:hypothetical protein
LAGFFAGFDFAEPRAAAGLAAGFAPAAARVLADAAVPADTLLLAAGLTIAATHTGTYGGVHPLDTGQSR